MKVLSFLKSGIVISIMVVLLFGCKERGGKIPFDEKNAASQVLPYKLLKGYIDSFAVEKTRLYSKINDSAYIKSSFDLPVAEMFNRDAILALLNAPGAEGIRIYLGKKTTGNPKDSANGDIVLVLLPVDAKGNDIKTKLVAIDARTGLRIPGISSAQAQGGDDAEGVEDGQRCPTMCSTQ